VTAEGSDLLTASEACRLLRLPKSTFYDLIAKGHLAHYRIPSCGGGRGAIRVHRDDLAQLLAGARREATRSPTVPDVDALLARVRARAGKDRP
jgi:excisionase family DNA binding protein